MGASPPPPPPPHELCESAYCEKNIGNWYFCASTITFNMVLNWVEGPPFVDLCGIFCSMIHST